MSSLRRRHVAGGLSLLLLAAGASAAQLPPHRQLRVLVVSDEVNPHGLSDDELTQPGDISAALRDPRAGLDLDPAPDGVLEIPTDDLELATPLLQRPRCDPTAYDVLIYFAHRIPSDGPDARARQDAFTAAVQDFLVRGGGVVSFHHGSYAWAGKEGMLDLIGGTASGAVPWDTVTGQDVIAVSPAHFVTTNGVAYDGTRTHADAARGVPPGDYSYFNNVPDERYPTFDLNASAGSVEILFESDYGGAPRLLGFTHRRAGWRGLVVAYQPGEYQPNALDPTGPNFQVLANAIVHAADALAPEDPLLDVRKGAAAGQVVLEWTGGRGEACVYRSEDPRTVTTLLGSSDTFTFTDDTAVAPRLHYVVESP